MKHIAILLATLVLVLGVHTFTRADAPAGVTKWEYKVLRLRNDSSLETELNKAGEGGWELQIFVDIAVFKRPAK